MTTNQDNVLAVDNKQRNGKTLIMKRLSSGGRRKDYQYVGFMKSSTLFVDNVMNISLIWVVVLILPIIYRRHALRSQICLTQPAP